MHIQKEKRKKQEGARENEGANPEKKKKTPIPDLFSKKMETSSLTIALKGQGLT